MNLAEILKAISEGDEVMKKAIIDSLKGSESLNSLLKAYHEAEWKKNIGPEIAKIHQQYDDDMFEILGVRKANDQKTYDFMKAQLKELKNKAGGGNDNEKIKELEAKLAEAQKGGKVGKHWEEKHLAALKQWEEERESYKAQIKGIEDKFTKGSIRRQLREGLVGLKFKEGFDDDVINALVNAKEKELLENAKLQDGRAVFYDNDNKMMLDSDYKPVTSKDIWSKHFDKYLAKEGDNSGGNNSGSKGGNAPKKFSSNRVITNGEGDNATKKLILDKNTFSTKMEFNKVVEKALRAEGYVVGSKEANKLQDAAYKEYGVSEMDLR